MKQNKDKKVRGHWYTYMRQDENALKWAKISDTTLLDTIKFKEMKAAVIGNKNNAETACIFMYQYFE